MNKLLPIAFLVLLPGCTWVDATDAGAAVRTSTIGAVETCERVGVVTANTRNTLGFERDAAKVANELDTLARNEAAGLGADTIVPVGPPQDGSQSFEAYRCN